MGGRGAVVAGMLLPGLVGAGLLWLAADDGWTQASFVRGAHQAQGTVTQVRTHSVRVGRQNSRVDCAMVRFVPAGMAEHTVEHHYGLMENALSQGEYVPVLYDPADADHAMVARFSSLWGADAAALILGLMFLGAAFLVYRLMGPGSGSAMWRP